jgi:hypothetical protein
VKEVQRQSQLPHIVGTAHAPGRFASRLDGREKQAHQDSKDCQSDQQLDKGECFSLENHRKQPSEKTTSNQLFQRDHIPFVEGI